MGKRAEGENYSQHSSNALILEHYCVCLKVSGPLVCVLRLVDGEKKTPMGYIYEAMNRAKDTNVRSLMEMKKSTKKSSTSLIRGGRFSFTGLCMQ